MVHEDASDMFVTAKLPVSAKINGELQPIDEQCLTPEQSLALVHDAMNDKQKSINSITKKNVTLLFL